MRNWFLEKWYQPTLSWWLVPLLPLSFLFLVIVAFRRFYLSTLKPKVVLPFPVVVVGNITLGGVGKTPCVLALAEFLSASGLNVVILSRGFGAHKGGFPRVVTADSSAKVSGDEPLLLAKRSGVPVIVDPDRLQGAHFIAQHYSCDVVVCDDGLQHYRLPRDIEWVVVHGQRRFGNGQVLPAGPLREPTSRLDEVDQVIVNGEPFAEGQVGMSYENWVVVNMVDPSQRMCLSDFVAEHSGVAGHLVAGVGDPQRFFEQMYSAGLVGQYHAFEDHHAFVKEDFGFVSHCEWVLMTEKDSVKCDAFAQEGWWYVEISASLPETLLHSTLNTIKTWRQRHG